MASISRPVQTTVNLSGSTAMEALLVLKCLDLTSQISVLPLLLPLVPMWTRTPGCWLPGAFYKPAQTPREICRLCSPPQPANSCWSHMPPKGRVGPQLCCSFAWTLTPQPRSWGSKSLHKGPDTGVTVVAIAQKICFARRERFSNVLLFP